MINLATDETSRDGNSSNKVDIERGMNTPDSTEDNDDDANKPKDSTMAKGSSSSDSATEVSSGSSTTATAANAGNEAIPATSSLRQTAMSGFAGLGCTYWYWYMHFDIIQCFTTSIGLFKSMINKILVLFECERRF